MRTRIACELATGHGGSLDTALKMVDAAAEAGADSVKVQHYGPVNPNDPQAKWLDQSRLSLYDIQTLMTRAHNRGLEFWATPFDGPCLHDLTGIGVDRIKIASSEASSIFWQGLNRLDASMVVSWPWGVQFPLNMEYPSALNLTAIPLYPTPLEAVYRAPLLDGLSDHSIGLHACFHAISQGAQWIEAHLTLGEGKSRVMVFDKHPDDFKRMREYADAVATMKTGVSEVFRERWRA